MIHPCDKSCGNKTASGYCATTICINPLYSNIGTAQYGQGVQKRIITNADKIRSMTDEELAEFLYNIWKEQDTFSKEVCERCGDTDIGCQPNCWLDWLKQEAEDG